MRRLAPIAAVLLFAGFLRQPSASAAPSPAAERIAFIRAGDLYTVRPDGSKLARLTRSTDAEAHPSWSPDRRWIALSARRRSIDVIRWDGRSKRPIVRVSDRFDRIDAVAWSPGGARIAFSTAWVGSRAHGARTCGYVWIVRRDGSGLHRIVSEQFPVTGLAWTPSGRGLVASFEPQNQTTPCRFGTREGIGRFRADGAHLRGLHAPLGTDPDVRPDGRRIAFRDWRRTCHACGDLFRMRPDGNAQHLLLAPPRPRIIGVYEPRYEPRGMRIALLAQNRLGEFSLWLARSDGSTAHHVLDHVDAIDW